MLKSVNKDEPVNLHLDFGFIFIDNFSL